MVAPIEEPTVTLPAALRRAGRIRGSTLAEGAGRVAPREPPVRFAIPRTRSRSRISAVLVDGKDLRHFKRFGRHVPPEIKVALELGTPPDFDGPVCSGCGNRFRPERDHLDPVVARGPTAYLNLEWKCHGCHDKKTEADRKAGKLKPPPDT